MPYRTIRYGSVRTRYRYPTSVSTVRLQYLYPALGHVRYDLNTGTGHIGKLPPKIPRVPVYPTEHTLAKKFTRALVF